MSAARMRTASRPSRKTMIAAFVDDRDVRLRAAADLLLRAGECVVERRCGWPRSPRRQRAARGAGRGRRTPRLRTRSSPRPPGRETVPARAGAARDRARRRRTPRAAPLRLLPVPCRRCRLQAVERGRDDVEVGGLRRLLPRGRIQRVDQRQRLVGRRRRPTSGAATVSPRAGVGERDVRARPGQTPGVRSQRAFASPPGRARGRGTRRPRRRGTSLPPGSRSRASPGRPSRRVRTRSGRVAGSARAVRRAARARLRVSGAARNAGERSFDARERDIRRPARSVRGSCSNDPVSARCACSARRASRDRRARRCASSRARARPSRRAWLRTPARRRLAARRATVRSRESYVSRRSRRTAAAAFRGASVPAASSSSATVASAAARENRVGGRNSRTSSQLRAGPRVTRRSCAGRLEQRDVARIVVQTDARAVASAAASPFATAASASASAARRHAEPAAARRAASRPRDLRTRRSRAPSPASPRTSAACASDERELDVAGELPWRGLRRGSRRCEPEEAQQCGCRDGPNHPTARS